MPPKVKTNAESETPAWAIEFKKQFKEEMKVMMKEVLDDSLLAIKTSVDSIGIRTSNLESAHSDHSAILDHMRDEHADLADRVTNLECRSMRENLIFSGIPEEAGEDQNSLKESLNAIITGVLDIAEDAIDIITCHRLRPTKAKFHNKDETRPRNVVARLSHKDQVFTILRSANKLKDHEPRIFINQQFPPEMTTNKRILQPVLYLAKQHKLKASLNEDKLIIDGIKYTVETIHDVPFDISSLNQKESDSTLVFHGRFSPFSNFYPAEFSVDGKKFTCSEQYYQYQKARTANDTKSAMGIMTTKDPLKMKRIGDDITPAQAKWQPSNHMKTGVMAKFSQNEKLLEVLKETRGKSLAEASYDKHWGCGIPLKDPAVLRGAWKGKNNMGKILENIRKELSS